MGNVPTSMSNKLQKAARTGNEQKFSEIIQANPTIDKNNRSFKSGNTPLHTAAKYGNKTIAAELINLEVDVNVKNRDGYTPLHLACINGQTETVSELLVLGADRDAAGGVWESTPLHWACITGHADVIKLLLEKGANTNARDGVGKVPFDFIKDPALKAELTGGEFKVESLADQEEDEKRERARLKEAANAKKAAEEAAAAQAEITSTPKERAPVSVEVTEEDDDADDIEVPKLPAATPTSASKSPKKSVTFKEGDRIEGKHQGGMRWYPGVIAEVNPDGTYEINYDDGDEESDVIVEYIRHFDGPLPVEESEEEESDEEYESTVRTIER